MVVIFGKWLNHSSPIEVLTDMIICSYIMMGKLLTTPMIYVEYSLISLRILLTSWLPVTWTGGTNPPPPPPPGVGWVNIFFIFCLDSS